MEKLKSALIVVVGLALLGAWAYHSWIAQPAKERQRLKEIRAGQSQRFQQWAYVAKEKEIAPGETVKLVIVPSPYDEALDTKCLIYTHREFRTSSMICPDASREFIEEKE